MSELDPRLHAFRPDLADAALDGRVAAARFVAGRPAQVACGVAALRRRPHATAPQDTQLLSGETVRVFDRADGWAWVQNDADGYVGYLEEAALSDTVVPGTHVVAALRSLLFPAPDLKVPPLDALTMTGTVAVTGAADKGFLPVRIGAREGWIYGRHLAPMADTAPDYVATALRFLGAPYLWGGKDSLGLDCSGLIQVVMARAGVPCPRDTDMQAAGLGRVVADGPLAAPPARGDVIFFPSHVAIALDGTQVVHANAWQMMVGVEPLADLERRVKAESGGTGVTVVRRP